MFNVSSIEKINSGETSLQTQTTSKKTEQQNFLNGNPDICFFKSVFRKNIKFHIFTPPGLDPEGDVNSLFEDKERQVKFILNKENNKYGNLISNMYFVFKLPKIFSDNSTEPIKINGVFIHELRTNFNWISRIGEYIIKECLIKIGSIDVDRIYGEWLHIWSELTLPENKKKGYNEMIGNIEELFHPFLIDSNEYPKSRGIQINGVDAFTHSIDERLIKVPLPFWFTQTFYQSLPISEMRDEVSVTFTLRPLNQLYTIFNRLSNKRKKPDEFSKIGFFINREQNFNRVITNIQSTLDISPKLELDMIYLNQKEIKLYSNKEYLITQLNLQEHEIDVQKFTDIFEHNIGLNFDYPTKFITFAARRSDFEQQYLQFNNYSNHLWDSSINSTLNPLEVQLNGGDVNPFVGDFSFVTRKQLELLFEIHSFAMSGDGNVLALSTRNLYLISNEVVRLIIILKKSINSFDYTITGVIKKNIKDTAANGTNLSDADFTALSDVQAEEYILNDNFDSLSLNENGSILVVGNSQTLNNSSQPNTAIYNHAFDKNGDIDVRGQIRIYNLLESNSTVMIQGTTINLLQNRSGMKNNPNGIYSFYIANVLFINPLNNLTVNLHEFTTICNPDTNLFNQNNIVTDANFITQILDNLNLNGVRFNKLGTKLEINNDGTKIACYAGLKTIIFINLNSNLTYQSGGVLIQQALANITNDFFKNFSYKYLDSSNKGLLMVGDSSGNTTGAGVVHFYESSNNTTWVLQNTYNDTNGGNDNDIGSKVSISGDLQKVFFTTKSTGNNYIIRTNTYTFGGSLSESKTVTINNFTHVDIGAQNLDYFDIDSSFDGTVFIVSLYKQTLNGNHHSISYWKQNFISKDWEIIQGGRVNEFLGIDDFLFDHSGMFIGLNNEATLSFQGLSFHDNYLDFNDFLIIRAHYFEIYQINILDNDSFQNNILTQSSIKSLKYKNLIQSAQLFLRDKPQIEEQKIEVFNTIFPYQHSTRIPELGINIYSFELKNLYDQYQPTGHFNLTTTKSISNEHKDPTFYTSNRLVLKFTPKENQFVSSYKLLIFSLNYNILDIKDKFSDILYNNSIYNDSNFDTKKLEMYQK